MRSKHDFISVLLILTIACVIVVVVYVAVNNLVTSFKSGSADAALYSKPTWYEIESETTSETTTTAETSEETSEETTGAVDIEFIED